MTAAKSKPPFNKMLALVVGIPLASVLFGVVMFYFALTSSDSVVAGDQPLSKTSWRSTVEQTP